VTAKAQPPDRRELPVKQKEENRKRDLKSHEKSTVMTNYHADPLFWQRFLKSAGFYQGDLDGDFGQQSQAAADRFEAQSQEIAKELGTFDPRTEGYIQTLQPDAQRRARHFLTAVSAQLSAEGLSVKVISGTRTYEEQDELFARGRTKPGPVVTRARGGQSNHNFGVAWDIGIFRHGEYIPESELYRKAGVIGKGHGLEWGGDWKGIQDEPHFQAIAEANLTGTRKSFEAGQRLIA
jgi:peptidoglycan L-alanyl-D-glutamate endopeptidase CwlK